MLGWDLGDLASSVTIHAFVRAPYDKYVHDDTSFWNASGLSVKLGGNGGISVQMESLRALLLGGIAFDTPSDSTQPVAQADHQFPLYAQSRGGAGRRASATSSCSLSYFPGSVAGLDVGADVTLHGLKVGEVTDVGLVYDPQAGSHRGAGALSRRGRSHQQYRGRPRSRSGNAGRRDDQARAARHPAVAEPDHRPEDHRPGAHCRCTAGGAEDARATSSSFRPPRSAASTAITRSANELLSKINRIDFDRIGKSIAGAAAGLDDTINGPQLKKTLAALEKAMIDVQDIARKLDTDATPALKRLPEIAAQLQESLTQANRLFGSLNTGYGDDSRFRRDLDRLLPQLTDAARSIRALTDLLSRHPEALIKGRTNTGKE